jgi:hypothetical protein
MENVALTTAECRANAARFSGSHFDATGNRLESQAKGAGRSRCCMQIITTFGQAADNSPRVNTGENRRLENDD